jgi:methylaspartate ammonia-lyase
LNEIPIFCQSGPDWYGLDSMVLKRVPVLPHGWINNLDAHVGSDGHKLVEYLEWVSRRVRQLRPDEAYEPTIHIDVYGTIGQGCGNDVARMTEWFERFAAASEPFALQVEGPLDAGSRDGQIETMGALRESLRQAGVEVKLVADEWCNTLADIREFADAGVVDMIQVKTPDLGSLANTARALLYCLERGVGAYAGGSANETDWSARVSTHVAVACGATQCLAKPGLGVDEGLMVVHNEMSRLLALARRAAPLSGAAGI